MENTWALLVFTSNPGWRQWLQNAMITDVTEQEMFSLQLISVTSRIEKTWRPTSQPKLTAASFTIFFKRQQYRKKKKITEFWTPKKKQKEVLLNYCNCHWNNPTKALPEWIGCLNTSKKLLPYSWILNMLSLGKSSMFSWHSKAQSWTYSLFPLWDNSPTQVLDVYLKTRIFFRSRQNAHCSILRSPQYSKWQWWQFTVFLNSTSGSNFLRNQVHSTWGHSKAFRHVLKAHPSSMESVFFQWA